MSYHFLLDLALILLSTKLLGLVAQKFQMPHDRVERCMRYVKAVEKDERRAEKARKARFEALLLERWNARQTNRENGDAEIQRVGN